MLKVFYQSSLIVIHSAQWLKKIMLLLQHILPGFPNIWDIQVNSCSHICVFSCDKTNLLNSV